MIATVALNPSVDLYFEVSKLHPEDTSRATRLYRVAGGKGVNVARVLRELGSPARVFALVGGATGREFTGLARTARVPLRAVPIAGETRTNIVIFDASDCSEPRVSGPGPRVTRGDIRRLEKAVLSSRGVTHAVLSGALPAGVPASVYADLTASFTRQGILTAVDADGEALRAAVRARVKPFLIKPNEHEFERLIGRRLRTLSAVRTAAEQVGGTGIPHVIVSMGARGAFFVNRGMKPLHLAPPSLRVRSRVCGGDSLLAGFLHALARGQGPEEASYLAMAAACSSVSAPSGVMANRHSTLSFVAKLTKTV